MAEDKMLQIPHKLTLDERERLTITGVSKVESIDEELAVIRTGRGELVVRGQQLHLQQLDLEAGQVRVAGSVRSLTYEEPSASGGFFARLFG